jgi:hypothetical protein
MLSIDKEDNVLRGIINAKNYLTRKNCKEIENYYDVINIYR